MGLTEILGLAAAGASGGLLGIVGGLFRQGLDWMKRRTELANELALAREKFKHDEAMRDKDAAILRLEGENAVKVAKTEGDSLIESERMRAIAASFAADRATFATGAKAADSAWFIAVDVVRGLIRPGLTLLFDLALFVIWGLLMYLLWDEMAKLFAAKDADVMKPMLGLLIEIVRAIIFLATTCTTYWFVARPHQETKHA